ncbi:MAG TPA: ComEC/Rec2 family competence protein [Candidatus Fimivivens faecavium]|nr:ComEC/Rec2 family competence protein [Candidatus Fimivivens faecavium]
MKRPLFWMGFVFLISIAAAFLFVPAAAFVSALSAAGVAVRFCAQRGRRLRALPLFLCCIVAAALAVWGQFALSRARLSPFEQKTAAVEMTVTGLEAVGRSYRMFGTARLTLDGKTAEVPVRLSSYRPFEAGIGDGYRCTASVGALPASWRDQYASKTVYLVLREEGEILPGRPFHPVRAALALWRKAVFDRTASLLPEETGGVLAALLTGDKSGIPDEVTKAFRGAGLSHVIAVSGMHLMIISALVELSLGAFRLSPVVRRGMVVLFAWGFALFTGMSPSIIRAAVMLSLSKLAQQVGRKADSLTSLTTAAVLMLAYYPPMIKSLSFQLSFAATLGIVLLVSPMEQILFPAERFKALGGRRWFAAYHAAANTVLVSLSAQLFTMPIVIIAFGELPLYGLLANLFAFPLILPAMVSGIFAAALVFLPPLAALFALASSCCLRLFLAVARAVTALPFALLGFHERYQILWLFLFCAAGLLLIAVRPRREICALALAAVLLPLPASSAVFQLTARDTAEILTFEKSGSMLVVRKDSAVLLGGPKDAYEARGMVESIQSLGVKKIQLAVFFEEDAAVSAQTMTVLRAAPPELVLCPDTAVTRAYRDSSGLPMGPAEQGWEGKLLGRIPAQLSDGALRLGFRDGSILKSEGNYDIIQSSSLERPQGDAPELFGRVLSPIGGESARVRAALKPQEVNGPDL